MIKDFFKDKGTISFISLALVLSFFALFVSSVFSPVVVSAASSVSYSIDYSGSVSYVSSSSVPFNINYSMSGNKILCVAYTQGGYNFTVYFTDYYFPNDSEVTFKIVFVNNQLSVNYVDSNNNSLYSSYYQFRNGNFYSSMTHVQGFSYGNVISVDNVYANSDFITDPVYRPSYDGLLVGFPVGLDFSVEDFMRWLVDNDKIAVSADSGGVSVGGKIPAYIGMSKLKSFLEFYKQFGSSNVSFVARIWSWFSHMNIVNQTNDNVVILKTTIDSLYREYINSYKHEFYSNSANQAHHRRNVNTQTTDDNLTLVTDDSNDDIYTTLLREIIRGIVALQSSVVSGLRAVIDTLNNLDFTVNVANNGGTGFDANSIWGTGDITQSENYLALTNAFMDKGVDVSAAENMQINYLDNATQRDSFTVSVVMPDQFVNGQFTEKTVTHTIDNTSKMYNTLILFRKLIAFAVVAYFAIRIRFELPHLIRGE